MKHINTTQLPKKLESHYLKKDYDLVLSLLLSNKSSYSKGEFHFNYGTVQLKMGNVAAGRYNLEKAVKEGFINPASLHNLEVAKKSLPASKVSLNSNSNSKFEIGWDKAFSMAVGTPSSVYLGLTLMMGIIFLLLVKVGLIRRVATMILALVLALSPLFVSKFYLENIDFAIALDEIEVREGPSKIYASFNKVPPGTKVVVSKDYNGWFLISHPSHLVGWVRNHQLALL